MCIKSYFTEILEGRRQAPFLKKLLFLFSLAYRQALRLRHYAYDQGWLKVYCPQVLTVSIGNIAAGGVGKTPLVKKLAEELLPFKKVAILTRGYLSPIEKSGKSVLWKGETAAECGDEPFWLATQLPQATIWIGKNRARSAALASAGGAEILLLEDGMQHRRLHRDVEIVVMDAQDLWSGGVFLPAGRLRDLPERLKVADLIVLTRVQAPPDLLCAKEALRNYTQAPLVGMCFSVEGKEIRGKKVGVLCAIGRPERFLETVTSLGAEVIAHLFAPDHASFDNKKIEDFALDCKSLGAELVVCTEKDGVKLKRGINSCLRILPLPGRLEVIAGAHHWNDLIEGLAHDRGI